MDKRHKALEEGLGMVSGSYCEKSQIENNGLSFQGTVNMRN